METKHEKTRRLLCSVVHKLKKNSIEKNFLLSKSRLSYKKLKEYFNDSLPLGKGSILSDPKLYKAFRDLKFLVEGQPKPISIAQASIKYKGLISEIQNVICEGETTIDFSKKNEKLYRKAKMCPHWPLVKFIAFGFYVRPEYMYWVDEDLIDAVGDYHNFTELKKKAGQLHRHIKGRALENRVLAHWPHYNSVNSYIGIDGYLYRSQGELVLGNLIQLCGLGEDWDRQVNTGLYRVTSNKPMTADFKCKVDGEFLVEVSMYEKNGRGSRGKEYEKRRSEKNKEYQKNKVKVLFIDVSGFYRNGFIDAVSFAEYCIEELKKIGYFGIGNTSYDPQKLAYFESIDARLDLSTEEFVEFLNKEYELNGVAPLSNNKSFLRKVINLRSDRKQVIRLLKKKAKEVRISKYKQVAREREYASLEDIKKLMKKNGIRTPFAWSLFYKENKELCKNNKIPSNLPEVYGLRKLWRGWHDMWN